MSENGCQSGNLSEIKPPAFSTLNHCVEITSAMFQLSHFYKLLAPFESRQMKDCFETLEPINLLISIDRFGETIFNVPALYTKSGHIIRPEWKLRQVYIKIFSFIKNKKMF